MAKTKVLFTFKVWDELKAYLQEKLGQYNSIDLIFPPDGEEETILDLASHADILFG